MGRKEIHALFIRQYPDKVSLSSIKRVLKNSGFVEERKRRKQLAPQRIADHHPVQAPNDVWTVDFKGWWYAKDRSRCEPLTVRDEFSCFILEAVILPSTRTEDVKMAFERVFKLYGLPRVIKSDNGSPFARMLVHSAVSHAFSILNKRGYLLGFFLKELNLESLLRMDET